MPSLRLTWSARAALWRSRLGWMSITLGLRLNIGLRLGLRFGLRNRLVTGPGKARFEDGAFLFGKLLYSMLFRTPPLISRLGIAQIDVSLRLGVVNVNDITDFHTTLDVVKSSGNSHFH